MRRFLLSFLLGASALAQFAFGFTHRGLKAEEAVLPPAPTEYALAATAFGDPQFLYRRLVFDLQNFGDTGGRITRMTDYPVEGVLSWLRALDALDANAGHHLLLATRYFAQTKDPAALETLVRYVGARADENPERHSVWLLDAVYLAEVRLKNPALASQLADIIDTRDPKTVPLVVRQMPAFVHEKLGDYAGAGAAMARILASRGTDVPADERAFMVAYVQQMAEWAVTPPGPDSPGRVTPPLRTGRAPGAPD